MSPASQYAARYEEGRARARQHAALWTEPGARGQGYREEAANIQRRALEGVQKRNGAA
jgi:hypothetical protein